MYNIIQGIKESAQSAVLAGAVSLFSAVGCVFDDSKLPGNSEACTSRDSYNLEVVVADYNTGLPIEGAIVRARWGDQSEGIICPVSRETTNADAADAGEVGSEEAGKYTCSDIPSGTSLEITVGNRTEIYAAPVVDSCEADQTRTYLFGANGSEDAGFDTLDAGHDHGHDLDAGYDHGHDMNTEPVEDARVDVPDVRDAAPEVSYDTIAETSGDLVLDTAADTLADYVADTTADSLADSVLDAADTLADYVADTTADSLADPVLDAADTLADYIADTAADSLADPVLDAVVDTLADTTSPDAETGSDADYTIMNNLNQIPEYRNIIQVLVPTPFLEVQARELGFLNVAQYDPTVPLVAPSTGVALIVYNACFAPEFSGHEGDCTATEVIQEHKTIVNLLEGHLVNMEVGGINEAAAALTLAANGSLEGFCQIVDGIDPETAPISDCPEE